MSRPFISVITVVRNAVDSIESCLRSVSEQNYQYTEHIVIDGASTDGTCDVLRRCRGKISCCISESDQGIYDAMNKGLGIASGRFVHFLNASDRYHDCRVLTDISRQLEESKVCFGDLMYVDKHGQSRNLGRPYSWADELKASRVPQPVLFVPLAFYRAVGGFDLRYQIAADYEMFLRLASRFPVKYISRSVTIMHSGGVSYQNPRLAFREARDISIRYGLPPVLAGTYYMLKLCRFLAARFLNRI